MNGQIDREMHIYINKSRVNSHSDDWKAARINGPMIPAIALKVLPNIQIDA